MLYAPMPESCGYVFREARPAVRSRALRNGADGVLIGGCHRRLPLSGSNYKALRRFTLLKTFLAAMGIEEKSPPRVDRCFGRRQGAACDQRNDEQVRNLGHFISRRSMRSKAHTIRLRSGRHAVMRAQYEQPKVAFYWCASCGGCEEAVVDLHEDILGVVNAVDIVLWPVALDSKIRRRSNERQEIAVAFINGAIRSSEQYEMVECSRRKAQTVVAFGAVLIWAGSPACQCVRSQSLYRSSLLNAVSVVMSRRCCRPWRRPYRRAS